MNAAQTASWLAWVKKNEPALTAFAKGEQVQVKCLKSGAIKHIMGDQEWNDVDYVLSSFDYEYRVKPNPRTMYIIEVKPVGSDNWTTYVRRWSKDKDYISGLEHAARHYPTYREVEFVESVK